MVTHTTIDAVAVPTTGDCTQALAMVRAFLEVDARRSGISHVCVAVDGTAPPHADVVDACRSLAKVHVRVRILERGAKHELAEALVAAGCDRESVVFALFDPLRVGESTGANRNAIQLATAGERVLSVDDDIAPRLFAAGPGPTDVAVSRTDPSEFWCFAEGETAARLHVTEADPIAAVAGGLQIAVPSDLPPIAASWLGTIGDPGTPNGLYMLLQDGPSYARVAPDDRRYETHWSSRRVMRAVMQPTICFGHGWTPAVVAYDHERLLPPFFPVLRGEGLVFGAVVAAGGAWSLARMPGALEHRLASPLRVEKSRMLAIASSMAVATMVQIALSRQRPASSAMTPERALLDASRRLADIARTTDALRQFVAHAVELRARTLTTSLQALVARHDRRPAAWAHDVDTVIAALSRQQAEAGSFVPYDLAGRDAPIELMRALVLRYARLLEHWPAIVEAARRSKRHTP